MPAARVVLVCGAGMMAACVLAADSHFSIPGFLGIGPRSTPYNIVITCNNTHTDNHNSNHISVIIY